MLRDQKPITALKGHAMPVFSASAYAARHEKQDSQDKAEKRKTRRRGAGDWGDAPRVLIIWRETRFEGQSAFSVLNRQELANLDVLT